MARKRKEGGKQKIFYLSGEVVEEIENFEKFGYKDRTQMVETAILLLKGVREREAGRIVEK